MIKEQFFDADGVLINFAEIPSVGQPLVLLHGATSRWQSFLPLIPTLTAQCHIYACDLRGHGRSSWVTGSYRLMDYAQDIRQFLEHRVAHPAVLYGHSLGALVGIAVAAEWPELVTRLILGDPPLFYYEMPLKESNGYEPFLELQYILNSMKSAQEIEDYIIEHYPNMDPERWQVRAMCLSHTDADVINALMDHSHMDGFDTDLLLRRVICPVLLFQGNPSLNAALRDKDVAYAMDRLQNCEVAHMQDIGHGLPPEGLFHKIADFLDRGESG